MDIEGTTTSISFVHDVLFPYARARMSTFLSTHSENKEVAIEVDALRSRLGLSSLTDVVSTLDRWMAEDRKETELKSFKDCCGVMVTRRATLPGTFIPMCVMLYHVGKTQGFSLRSILLAQSLHKNFFFSTVTQAILMPCSMRTLIQG